MSSTTSSILLGGATGVIFGTALEKSKVFLPIIIRNQMLFRSFTMLKMFLAASATGICMLSLYRWLTNKSPSVRPPTALGLGIMKGYGGNIVGGLILGAGMGIAGSCPGTVFVQLGAGVPTAIYTLSGGFVGASLFTLIDAWVSTRSTFGQKGTPVSVNEVIGISPNTLSIAASVAIVSFVAFLEQTFPWTQDLAPVLTSPLPTAAPMFSYDITAQAWSPISSGILIGLLQVPSFVSVGALLGTSSSFVAVIANLVKKTAPSLLDKLPYLKKFLSSQDYWQMGIATGLVAAGYISSHLGRSTAIVTGSVSPVSAFFGGVLLLLGARTAGGCTSGHGLSGMATLSVASLLTVASMFGGAIAVTNLLYH